MKYLFLPVFLFICLTGYAQAQFDEGGSIAPTFDAILPAQLSTERPELIDETLTLRGEITGFDFTQPETRILIDANLEQWELVAPSAVELRRLGWTSSSLFSGELVEAEVVRLLGVDITGNQRKARLKKLTRANGALLLTSINTPETAGFDRLEGGMYSLLGDYSNLKFSYNHMGLADLDVRFERVNADILWNSNSPELSIIQLNIDASSLSSGVSALDDRLGNEEFFDSFNYPRIQFRSTQVRLLKWGNLQIGGQLEIKGVNQPVQLQARLNKSIINPMTQELTVGLSLSGTVKRSDWGLNGYEHMVADEITIAFSGEFALKAADIPSARPATHQNSQIPERSYPE